MFNSYNTGFINSRFWLLCRSLDGLILFTGSIEGDERHDEKLIIRYSEILTQVSALMEHHSSDVTND